jgi:hypothetical protein
VFRESGYLRRQALQRRANRADVIAAGVGRGGEDLAEGFAELRGPPSKIAAKRDRKTG